ncbi:TIGR02281 family clan AA aspartic protease [Nitratireductor kimnyeongensis]|uniref:TIGR02281 family clan AA aspartic protease n=1 Tax=Nitratireductor kimnyeongensis TaxID=430679 RepID=A0ABW0TE60_9HYPH|nr:TIGR02281 family clan AA aspartic protease [Nitratireductor kimnyeongensis]QZZ37198.1 TIGR02281 family clan AA aspartic protease [Nitratireductor kimnyeongensis]
MYSKMIMLGIAIGAAGGIPALYQSNPEFYRGLLHLALTEQAEVTPHQVATARPSSGVAQSRGETSVLLGKKVSITADEVGHYVGRFKLNGREMNAMVDTGATYVAINRETARRIGVNLMASDFRYEVNTANGKVRAAAATIESLQIGRIYVENVDAVVLDERSLDKVLIGMSFLERLSRFQVENRALVLEQ